MRPETIKEVVDETQWELLGRPGQYPATRRTSPCIIDFRSKDKDFCSLSVDPPYPRIHLISSATTSTAKTSLRPFGFCSNSEK